ncbi:uncharacterized protein KY384_000657 [Bacidia gigantensis]|uniref:uncharacterized protein n=1 Tax=Bacidia gigantensis TaxID=2732470 RepID=UPI001D038A5F|nr:uncharacterized protein KY384_000657 [Bacidia gigantensis]KAG8525895.1 hypothetical protein KY384_000657 [Bacidia gigantensis]
MANGRSKDSLEGISKVKTRIPANYPLREYYLWFGYVGLASWMDYYAAGASVFYGLYYTPIRVFRLEQEQPAAKATILRLWTFTCIMLYTAHIFYLTFIHWNYTYNMAANVAAGIVQNLLWSSFSYTTYQKLRKPWAAWPGMIVAWIILAMSLELLDFPPIAGVIDAHSLWHLGTVVPTIWWYNFLVKDAQQDITGERLKA